jgi:hypothetical protein
VPYTFGAAAGDDISWSITVGQGSNSSFFVCGWFRPTTLTAGRKLWGLGAITNMQIAPTTSELRMNTDFNTTDGVYTTTGAGLAVDEWVFIAAFWHGSNTSSSSRWRVWKGTTDTAPVELTVTVNTAGTSTVTTANTTFTCGNQSAAASTSFQGQIADLTYAASASPSGTFHPFLVTNYSGNQTAEQLEHIYTKMVLPAWLGNVDRLNELPSSAGNSMLLMYASLADLFTVVGNSRNSATIQPFNPTIAGATSSSQGAPRPRAGMAMLSPRRR